MVSNPNGIPPAFRARRREAASFTGLDDDQVLKIAQLAFTMAQTFPVASSHRAAEWDRFDDAMSELAARGLRHILRKLRERSEPGDGQADPGDTGPAAGNAEEPPPSR